MKKTLSVFFAAVLMVPAGVSAATFTQGLSVGSRHAEVLPLQQILVKLGFLKVAPTGYYGALTKAAVLALQKSNGLEQVGSVGPKTRAILNGIAEATVMVSQPAQTMQPSVPISPVIVGSATPTIPTSTQATSSAAVQVSNAIEARHVLPAAMLPRDTRITNMVVATTKPANCKWGTLESMQLSAMTAFTNSGGTTHTHEFTNLYNGYVYQYFVKCEDTSTLQISPEIKILFGVSAY